MMGTSHAATGLLAGAAVGSVLGSHAVDPVVCAAVGAGAALLPDLDEPGSTVGRSLGLVTTGAARALRAASRAVYEATATEVDLRAGKDGGHRHLTHTLPAVLLFGAAAWGLSAAGPLGVGVVVFAMAALGLGAVGRAVGLGVRARQATAGAAVLAAAAAVLADGGGPVVVGATVGLGALVHVLGDWLTRSGVPLAWPFTVRGKRWWMFRSPVAFHTGRSPVELVVMWGSVGASVLVVVLGFPVVPVA
jgi:membrane-bound metal-dependent hydrolase YbcI (DUF457 family)